VPARLDFGFGPSAEVGCQLDNLVNRVVEQALEWGYAFRSRVGDNNAA